MPDRPAVVPPPAFLARIARFRVPLGFVFGMLVLWLAQPTVTTLLLGGAIALAGEAIRVWAAGHLEKGREVTKSGPYRWTRHPLYVGSTIMGLGLAIASARMVAAVLVLLYLGLTLTAAIRTEEAWLRARFGGEYDDYRDGRVTDAGRRFSLERALVANREHRALVGLGGAIVALALKAVWD